MAVSSTNLRYPTFQGTQDEAKARVRKLQQGLAKMDLAEGGSKPNLISLKRVNRSGTESSFTISSFSQPKERRTQTVSYLTSLIDTLYPNSTATEAQQSIKATFAAYLNGTVETTDQNKNSGDISAERLLAYLHDLQLARLDAEAVEAGAKAGALPFSNEMPEKIEGSLSDFLARKEVVPDFNRRVGEGNFGIVMRAAVKGDEEKYVYKHEKRDVSKALTERSSSFWREGDCAAARLRDILHVPRPLFFIFRISREGKPEELHYVPANHVKAFGMRLPPGTTVFLEGQLMERAPGENLATIISKSPTTSFPIGGRHFNNIVRGLFHILQELQAHNLVHRDIKPENIFYNIQTGEVTLLDFGSATKLRKKEKVDDGSHLHESSSRMLGGTRKYISPRVLQQRPYGSEVDLFSFAMTMLELINKREFESFGYQRFFPGTREETSDNLFATCPPTEYLNRFLEAISNKLSEPQSHSLPTQPSFIASYFGSSGSSNSSSSSRNRAQSAGSPTSRESSYTARVLERNSAIKTIINLAFQASGGGPEGAEAYHQLENMPYFQQESPSAITDFPDTTASAKMGPEKTDAL